MIVHGLNKLSLLDYPEHTTCTVFTGECNFRCPFCQNGGLVMTPFNEPRIDMDFLFSFLEKRKNVIQGVCITGGEPTLQKDLPDFIRRVRNLGYLTKLDTNGYNPDVLENLLREGLLDAVAIDIKSSGENYAKAAGLEGCSFDFSRIERSAALLMDYAQTRPDFYYEFRTTLVKGLQTEEDFVQIGKWLSGAEHYFLQSYKESECVIDRTCEGFTLQETQEAASILREYIPNVQRRG